MSVTPAIKNEILRLKVSAVEHCMKHNKDFVATVIREATSSKVSDSALDKLMQQFVFAGMKALRDEYNNLYELFHDDASDASDKEFTRHASAFLNQQNELEWPWPLTEPPKGMRGGGNKDWPNQYSGLLLCGYRVGRTNGMPDKERRSFLDYYFRNQLPSIVYKYHGSDYGSPGSEERLRKMANVIAANCRNFKKIDRIKYRVAIRHYEQDLEYLRQSYYRAGSFPWPPIEN